MLFMDSGAWSAYSRGIQLSVETYGQFLLKWSEYISVACNLDAIREPEKTRRNMEILEDMGVDQKVKLMTVFHQSEELGVLTELLDEGRRYIGISPEEYGGAQAQRSWLMYEVIPFLQPHRHYHLFGVGSTKIVREFVQATDTSCLITADSRSWAKHAEVGVVILPTGERISLSEQCTPHDHYSCLSALEQVTIGRLLHEYGLRWENILGSESEKVDPRKRFNAMSLVRFQHHLNSLRRENPSPRRPDPLDDASSEKFDSLEDQTQDTLPNDSAEDPFFESDAISDSDEPNPEQ